MDQGLDLDVYPMCTRDPETNIAHIAPENGWLEDETTFLSE